MAARRGFYSRNQTVLALDIGSRFIKIAELRMARGVISVLGVAACPTPEGVVDNTQILDPVTLGRTVKELVRVSKMNCRNCIVSISSPSSVVVRPVELPRMTRRELEESMKFEVERHIPFSADEIIMDYAPLEDLDAIPEEQANMKVLLAVAQEELIDAYVKVLRVAGLSPAAMDVEILSAMRAIVDIHAMDGSYERTYALVNIGASSTEISVVEHGNVVFTRSVRIAGDQLTEAIAEQLGRSFDEAEELKKSQGRVFLEVDVEELPAPGSDGHVPDFTGSASFGGQHLSFMDGQETGGMSAAPAVDPGLTLQNVFSLEDDPAPAPANSGMFTLDEAPSFGNANAASPFLLDDEDPTPTDAAASPFMLEDETAAPASASPFMLDDDDAPSSPFMLDDPTPTTLHFDADEQAPIAAPAFQLLADDDEPAFSIQPDAAPSMAGPVFDLSSELEEQRPIVPRSTFGEEASPVVAEQALDSIFSPVEEDEPVAPAAAFGGFGNMDQTMFMSDAAVGTPTYERPDGPQEDVFQRRIFDAMLPTLGELVTEIQRSLEYYSSHESTATIDRVVLYGGTSRLPRLADFIQQEIGVDARCADPLEYLDLSTLRQSRDYIKELAPALPICIGLGLRDMLA